MTSQKYACGNPELEPGHRLRGGRRRSGVAVHGAVQQPGIHDCLRKRAEMIEGACERHDAAERDFVERRLETDDAARCGGDANRSARVAAERGSRHTGDDRRR
jgi:hypothetical protein